MVKGYRMQVMLAGVDRPTMDEIMSEVKAALFGRRDVPDMYMSTWAVDYDDGPGTIELRSELIQDSARSSAGGDLHDLGGY